MNASRFASHVGSSPVAVPPVITSLASRSINENSVLNHSLTANEPVTWAIAGGADAALFSLAEATLTLSAKDFESPVDDGADGDYDIQIEATSIATGLSSIQNFSASVSDLADVAPVITSADSISVGENTAFTHNLTANEDVTWSLITSLDSTAYSLDGAVASFDEKNYEIPTDAGTNNTYQATFRATSTGTGLTADQTFTTTITNIADAATLTAPTFSASGPYSASAVEGTELATIGNLQGATLSITPNDGRVVFNGDQTKLLKGLAAWSEGEITFSIVKTLADSPNSGLATDWVITVGSVATIPDLVPGTLAEGLWAASSIDDTALPYQGSPGEYGYLTKPKGCVDAVMYDDVDSDDYIVGIQGWKSPTYVDYALGREGHIKEAWVEADGGESAGGTKLVLTNFATNPKTGVGDCLLFRVKKSSYAASKLSEIRVTLVPYVGKPRVLQGNPTVNTTSRKFPAADQWSLKLFINKGDAEGVRPVRFMSPTGSDANNGLTAASPKLTYTSCVDSLLVEAGSDLGGCKVHLLPGSYANFGDTTDRVGAACAKRWVTACPQPGFTKADVTITSFATYGLNVYKARLHDIAVTGEIKFGTDAFRNTAGAAWGSNLFCQSPTEGYYVGNSGPSDSANGGIWWTDTTVKGYNFGLGHTKCVMVRKCVIDHCQRDALTSAKLVLDCVVKNHFRATDETGAASHPDVYQFVVHSPVRDNIVIYKLKADENNVTQGMFGDGSGDCNGVAVIGCSFYSIGGWTSFSIGAAIQDSFFKDLTVTGRFALGWTTDIASGARFVNLTSGYTRAYKQGVSYLYPGMAPGEPFEGVPPESNLITILGDVASGGKLISVMDAIMAHRVSLTQSATVEEDPRVSSWNSGLTNSPSVVSKSTEENRPFWGADAFPGGYPAVDFDKSDGIVRALALNSVSSYIQGSGEAEVFVVINNPSAPLSALAGENQVLFEIGGSSSSTKWSLQKRPGVDTSKVRFFTASGTGPSGTGTTNSNAVVEDVSFVGLVIVGVAKLADRIVLRVWNEDNPTPVSATTLYTAGHTGTIGNLRTSIGNAYTNTLGSGFSGEFNKFIVTTVLTDVERDAMIADIKDSLGLTW